MLPVILPGRGQGFEEEWTDSVGQQLVVQQVPETVFVWFLWPWDWGSRTGQPDEETFKLKATREGKRWPTVRWEGSKLGWKTKGLGLCEQEERCNHHSRAKTGSLQYARKYQIAYRTILWGKSPHTLPGKSLRWCAPLKCLQNNTHGIGKKQEKLEVSLHAVIGLLNHRLVVGWLTWLEHYNGWIRDL